MSECVCERERASVCARTRERVSVCVRESESACAKEKERSTEQRKCTHPVNFHLLAYWLGLAYWPGRCSLLAYWLGRGQPQIHSLRFGLIRILLNLFFFALHKLCLTLWMCSLRMCSEPSRDDCCQFGNKVGITTLQKCSVVPRWARI